MSYNESKSSQSNYPLMTDSEWENAPWNEEPMEEVKVNVVASCYFQATVLLSRNEVKRATIGVPIREEGIVEPPDNSILVDAVEQQVLPHIFNYFVEEQVDIESVELD